MIMHTKWICQVSIMSMLPLLFTDPSPFDVGDALNSRMNPFEERGNVMEWPIQEKHDPGGRLQAQEESSPISIP